jgi:membrane protease YdiL (CAAX protease family)
MSTAQFPVESAPPAHTDDGPRLRILGPVLIVLASFMLSLMVFGLLKAFSLSDDSAGAVASFTGSAAILGFGLLARARLAPHERRQVTSPRWSLPAAMGVGVGLGIAARIGIGVLVGVGQSVDPGICRKLVELDNANVPPALWHKLLLAIALVVLAPLGEELVFRGLLLRGLVRRMRFPFAAVISGVVFGFAHLEYWTLWPLLVGICGFGIAAAFVYRRMGFAANVAMHAMFNGIAAVFIFSDFGIDQGGVTCT